MTPEKILEILKYGYNNNKKDNTYFFIIKIDNQPLYNLIITSDPYSEKKHVFYEWNNTNRKTIKETGDLRKVNNIILITEEIKHIEIKSYDGKKGKI